MKYVLICAGGLVVGIATGAGYVLHELQRAYDEAWGY